MNSDEVEWGLIERVAGVRRARRRLGLVRRDALRGRCDHLELALAVDAHRRAVREMEAAFDAWSRARRAAAGWGCTPDSERPVSDAGDDTSAAATGADASRLRFARWLVECGRLSEWPAV